MGQGSAAWQSPVAVVQGRLGAIGAIGMGWRFIGRHFWPMWVASLVVVAIQAGIGLVGSIPYLGLLVVLGANIFFLPPLAAGFYFAVRRAIYGNRAKVRDVFEGFRQRYWESVVAFLLSLLGGVVAGLVMAGMIWGTMAASGEMNGGHASREAGSGVAAIAVPVLVVFSLLTAAFAMFFAFIYLTVWEHPHSGWAAVKASMRLVWSHFWSVLGLFILFGLIFTMVMLAWGLVAFFLTLVSPILALLANLAGLVALFFMMPVFLAWQASAVTYLYHSWTGQLLDQSPAPDTGTPALPTGMFPPPPLPGQGG